MMKPKLHLAVATITNRIHGVLNLEYQKTWQKSENCDRATHFPKSMLMVSQWTGLRDACWQ